MTVTDRAAVKQTLPHQINVEHSVPCSINSACNLDSSFSACCSDLDDFREERAFSEAKHWLANPSPALPGIYICAL